MKKICIVLTILLSFVVSANAELVDNGDGTVTQIRNDGSALMWLKDANTPISSGYCSVPNNCDGWNMTMTWYQADEWVGYLNSSNYLGYNDWRLPATDPVNGVAYDYQRGYSNGSTDINFNISAAGSAYPGSTSSEMAYMYYYELGNQGQYDLDGSYLGLSLTNTGPFANLIRGYYWSGTEYDPTPDSAWVLGFTAGNQDFRNMSNDTSSAWAVRDTTVVPEPISSALFLIGGAALGFRRFRKTITN